MFVWTAKISRKNLLIALLAAVAIILVICVTIMSRGGTEVYDADAVLTEAMGKRSLAGATGEERRAFLAFYGWQTEEDAREFYEVTVPKEFDKVYEHYNELQKAQDFDLRKYRGKQVMKYSYVVTNYPDYDGAVYATLLVYKNRIIGGDISSARLDGFMHGFARPDAAGGSAETAAPTE